MRLQHMANLAPWVGRSTSHLKNYQPYFEKEPSTYSKTITLQKQINNIIENRER